MAPGALITIISGGFLDIDSSTVTGCTNMWRGIKVLDLGELMVQEGSLIADGDTSILAYNKAKVTLHNAYLRNFVIGLYVPPTGNAFNNGTSLTIKQTTFDFTAFKPDYIGQANHGAKPQCGMFINDWIGTIGSYLYGYWKNNFLNLNCGMALLRSNVTVKNCYFSNMQPEAFYGKAFNGSAVYSAGYIAGAKYATLKLQPVLNNLITMVNCFRGVDASYCDLNLNNVRMDSMWIGVQATLCRDYLNTTITNNIIHAYRAGVMCHINAGSALSDISGNSIYMNSTGINAAAGIVINETNKVGLGNYTLQNNLLYLYDCKYGIQMKNVYKPLLAHNYIEQHGTSLFGIHASNCDSTHVRCNQVRTMNTTNANSKGIFYSLSKNAEIACNSIDTAATGIWFGGNCLGTQLKGNTMRNNWLGLYINNVGLIGVQPNHGNMFINYRDTIGAYNANVSGLFLSQFRLRTTDVMGNIYYPVLAQQNNSWFNPIATTGHYQCGAACYDMLTDVDNETLYRIIAGDSILTESFIPESQSMARQYVFEILYNNPDLLASDTLFQQFYNNMLAEADAQLVDVKRNFENYGKMDSTFVPLLNNVDSLIRIYEYWLSATDSICDVNKDRNCDSLREAFALQIENLAITRQNIMLQYKAIQDGEKLDGEIINNLINPDDVTEYFSARLNEIFSNLEDNIYSNTDEYFNELMSIAMQCPYYGGEAVYRARTILELMNDSLIYDDDINCLIFGYYKMAGSNNSLQIEDINVKPNPTRDNISVKVNCNNDETFIVDIHNSVGQTVLQAKLKCNIENILNLNHLQQGVYSIIIKSSFKTQSSKLIILK
jgi:hypothetical protein